MQCNNKFCENYTELSNFHCRVYVDSYVDDKIDINSSLRRCEARKRYVEYINKFRKMFKEMKFCMPKGPGFNLGQVIAIKR